MCPISDESVSILFTTAIEAALRIYLMINILGFIRGHSRRSCQSVLTLYKCRNVHLILILSLSSELMWSRPMTASRDAVAIVICRRSQQALTPTFRRILRGSENISRDLSHH